MVPYISNNLIKHQSFVYTPLNHQTVLFKTFQLSWCTVFVCAQLNVKTVLFQTCTWFCSFWLLDRTLSGSPTLGQGVPCSDKLDVNYTRMLRAILNRSRRQHPTKRQLYDHLPSITKTIQVRRTRRAGHCWRSRDELIRDVLLWTPTYGQAKAGRLARTYIQQLCEDMGCIPEDQPEAMNDGEKWRERIRDIRASGTTWWWWGWLWFRISKAPALLNNLIQVTRWESLTPQLRFSLCILQPKSTGLSNWWIYYPLLLLNIIKYLLLY